MKNLEANSKSIQPETEKTGGNKTNSNASPVLDDRTDPPKLTADENFTSDGNGKCGQNTSTCGGNSLT